MHTLYTAGYRKWKVAQLRRACEERAAVVVDVRFSPNGRGPFQKENLEVVLGQRNYRWAQALGNKNYKGGPIELLDPEYGYTRLIEFLKISPVIVLCACEKVHVCHRKVIADEIHARTGCEVVHLEAPREADPQMELTF